MLRHLRSSNFVLIKFIDEFVELSAAHQNAFVAWFHESIADERWNDCASDRMQYKEFIKALVMHYSGSDLRNEPSFKDFASEIAGFLKSEQCTIASKAPKKTMKEMLEEAYG